VWDKARSEFLNQAGSSSLEFPQTRRHQPLISISCQPAEVDQKPVSSEGCVSRGICAPGAENQSEEPRHRVRSLPCEGGSHKTSMQNSWTRFAEIQRQQGPERTAKMPSQTQSFKRLNRCWRKANRTQQIALRVNARRKKKKKKKPGGGPQAFHAWEVKCGASRSRLAPIKKCIPQVLTKKKMKQPRLTHSLNYRKGESSLPVARLPTTTACTGS